MAVQKLQKINVTGLKEHYPLLMKELLRMGKVQITTEGKAKNVASDDSSTALSQMDFAINFLQPYQPSSEKLDSMLSGGKIILTEKEFMETVRIKGPGLAAVIKECEKMEDNIVRHKNEIKNLEVKKTLASSFEEIKSPLEGNTKTEFTESWIISIFNKNSEELFESIAKESNLVDIDILGKDKIKTYARITAYSDFSSFVQEKIAKSGAEIVNFKQLFGETNGKTISEIQKDIALSIEESESVITASETRAKEISLHVNDLKVLYDYELSKKDKECVEPYIAFHDYVFSFDAWVPESDLEEFKGWVQNSFVEEVAVEVVTPHKGENAPSAIENKGWLGLFEPITRMYGLPQSKEIDPTPYLAPFFIVFFGLCLSDVGYGALLVLASAYFLLKGTFSVGAQQSIKLVLWCGIAAIIGGIFLGGYFGMTPEQFSFLADGSREGMFIGQLFRPDIDVLTFLGLCLGLGYLHILFAKGLEAYMLFKEGQVKKGILDPIFWMLLLLAIGNFAVAMKGIGMSFDLAKYLLIFMLVLVILSEGRHKKNIFMKVIFGLLGLFGITAYLSDLLSYSRIMALGMATGVIGASMNKTGFIIGGMVENLPVIGGILSVLLIVVVILFGHTLNFFLSLLSAFIHSARLQFIEFFKHFYEGGAPEFSVFQRPSKYIFLKKD